MSVTSTLTAGNRHLQNCLLPNIFKHSCCSGRFSRAVTITLSAIRFPWPQFTGDRKYHGGSVHNRPNHRVRNFFFDIYLPIDLTNQHDGKK